MQFKPLVLTLLVLALPVYGQKAAGEKQHDQKTTKTQQNEIPHAAAATDIGKPAAEPQEQGHANQPDGYFDTLFSPNNIPNVALALVGIVGIIVALRTLNWLKTQTRAIERQGDFLREQVILMQAPHRQWIQLQNWRTHFDSHTEELLIQVDLINPTEFPVSVFGSMTVKTSNPGGYSIGDPLFLPPNSPNTIEVLAYLRDDEIARLNGDAFSVQVNGRFSHSGFVYTRRFADQEFWGWLECGVTKQAQFRGGGAQMRPEYY
jgi:hypothetical protein